MKGEIIEIYIDNEPIGKLTHFSGDVKDYPKPISRTAKTTQYDFAWILFQAMWYSEYYRN